jgi:signal peptidase II
MVLAIAGIFIVDQGIKEWAVLTAVDMYKVPVESLREGLYPLVEGSCINLDLIFNKGVAFSMFAFLKEWLKWIQLLLISGVVVYTLYLGRRVYIMPVGILVGAGFSNVYDRFIHGGVVDYVHWHCGFDFAIFNFADVMIDISVVWLLWINWKMGKEEKTEV